MIKKVAFVIAFLASALAQKNFPPSPSPQYKVVCYYDSKGNFRTGEANFNLAQLEEALQFCTHLVYGFAGINPTSYNAIPLSEQFDLIGNHFRDVTNLKRRFPGLRVLLSIGGDRDDPEHSEKYLTLLESLDSRIAFINTAEALVSSHGFDGIDLAWQFPKNKPKKIHDILSTIWTKVKHTFVSPSDIDPKHAEHKNQFSALVRDLKNKFSPTGLLVSMSVLPNVNSSSKYSVFCKAILSLRFSVFHDVPKLAPYLDFVNLWAFDYYTPQRNPKEADYSAPLQEMINRKNDENGNHIVQFWLQNGCPSNKLILGVPTFSRTWTMTKDSGTSGVPPIDGTKGAGEPGSRTKVEGLLSYEEVCTLLTTPPAMKKVVDPTGKYGNYAFKLPDNDKGGIWVSYEDPFTAEQKASYVRGKALGGISVIDLTLDDFRGGCSSTKYPILRAVKTRL
ncbi:hypothetical protein FQA39_LY13088 [Lamprigera yunnana]|nr:hypothetical protein FQA39_LY13088 [Lamprigera yunnana]